MGWIIFSVIILAVALEALFGALRGIKFSGIRLAFTVLGTVIAALIAKRLTVTIVVAIANANGYQGDNLTEIVTGFFANSDYAAIGNALAPHIAGLSLSVLIPMIFIPLFLVFKLIGLFLYLITKAIIKSVTSKKTEENPEEKKTGIPAYSRILGGVLGAIVGLFACALVTMPTFNVVTTINNSGMKDTIFSMLEKAADGNQVARNEIANDVLEALAYGDAIPVYAADSSSNATIGGIKLSTIKSLFESTANSPAIVVLKYTGVEAASNAIINASTTVKPADIGATDVKTESYNLAEALTEILEVAEPVTQLVVVVISEEKFSIDELDKVTEFADKLGNAGFLEEEDKLEILNACKDVVTDTIYKELGIDPSTTESTDYSDVGQFKNDVEALVEMSKVIASITGGDNNATENGGNAGTSGGNEGGQTVSGSSLANVDVEALIKDPEKLKSFISSTMSLTNGPEIIANLVNTNVSKYTNGKYTDVITPETIKSVGKDAIVELSDSLMKFTKYDENTVWTDELRDEIYDAIDQVVAKGLLTKDLADEIKKELK